jgi:IS605 OrfB family transposase
MELVRTICCKLDPTAEQALEIDATLKAFAAACNRIANVCRAIGSTNKIEVQEACYHTVRAEFGLSANLTIRAIARACTALKVPNRCDSMFNPTSIDYDVRIFRFHENDWTFGLTLLQGRERFATSVGDFQRDALRDQYPTSATLVKRPDGGYFLHVQIKDEAPESITVSDVIGVDLGVVNLAVDSDGEVFSGAKVEEVRKRYGKHRRNLNRCGSKSARRHLRKIRKKEARFRANENHRITKCIVEKAKDTGSVIALEDLQGIGSRTTARGPDQLNRLKGWAFHQLRGFLTYKAARAGVPVVFIDPRNTSRTCSQCGHCEKANRRSRDQFVCRACGHESPADENAARNIRDKGASSCALLQGSPLPPMYPAKTACKPPVQAVRS